MNEMVRRVAAAVCSNMPVKREHQTPSGRAWVDEKWVDYVDIARTTIEAMREPTEAMLCGARDWSIKKNGMGVGNDQATGCWQAMIDAATMGAPLDKISELEAEVERLKTHIYAMRLP
jgi:hypothetical protein